MLGDGHLRTLSLGLLALLAAGLAEPASALDYQVELVLFAYLDPDPREGPTVDVGGPAAGGASFASAPRRLGGVAERLRNSRGYRVLAHEAWTQPDLPPARARAVGVSASDPEAGDVAGTVSLRRQRVMMAEIDLWYEDPRTYQRYRLHEVRRVRSGELHYFDHPRFGLVLEIDAGAQ